MKSLVLAVMLSMGACGPKTIPVAAPPQGPTYWTIPNEAAYDDIFCVINPQVPWLQPEQIGLRCIDVKTLRQWMGGLRQAE